MFVSGHDCVCISCRIIAASCILCLLGNDKLAQFLARDLGAGVWGPSTINAAVSGCQRAACPLAWPAHLHGGPFYYCGGESRHIVAWLGCLPWTKQGQSGMSSSGSLPAAGFRVRELNHAAWLTHVSTRCVVVVDGSAGFGRSVSPVVLLVFNLLADPVSRNGIFFFFYRNGKKKDLLGWACKYKSQHAVIPRSVCLIITLNLITFEAKFFL